MSDLSALLLLLACCAVAWLLVWLCAQLLPAGEKGPS